MQRDSNARPAGRRALVMLHLITTGALVGADLALFALGFAGVRGADPVAVYPAAHLVAAWLVAPLAVASLASGLALALTSSWRLLTQRWLAIKLTVTVVLVTLLLYVLIPGLDKAALESAQVSESQRLRFVIAPAVAALSVIANSLLGRYKPSWGLRATQPRPTQE